MGRVKAGAWVQNGFTVVNVLLILVFVIGAAWLLPASRLGRLSIAGAEVTTPHFAVGLILVSFAYAGWNGAAYLAGEVRRPARNLPVALVVGTTVVMLLYVALNAVFLLGTEPRQLVGTVEVGHVAAVSIFGAGAGTALSGLIAVALVSMVSSLIRVGPRIYEAMGEDYVALRFLRLRSDGGGPATSIALQSALAVLMLLTFSFNGLLTYIGFTLSAMAALTVAGVFVHRRRQPAAARPYRTWGYPVTPAAFVLFSLWMIVQSLAQRPAEALLGGATVAVGLLLYLVVRRRGYTPVRAHVKGAPP
jgi:APA family basic amino acid/polyamine antiporter